MRSIEAGHIFCTSSLPRFKKNHYVLGEQREPQTDFASENYLGHSVNAPAGRWQKNKDVHWYSRDNDPSDEGVAARERRKELKALKEAEEEALSVALGFAPSAKKPEVDMQEGSSMPRGAKDEEIERLEKEERKREKEYVHFA